MGRYEEKHYISDPLTAFLGGPYTTVIKDEETGNETSASGSTREEANRAAFNSLQEINRKEASEKFWSEFWFGNNKNGEVEETHKEKSEESYDYGRDYSPGEDRHYTTKDSGSSSNSGVAGCFITFLAVLGLIFGGSYLSAKQRKELDKDTFPFKFSRRLSLEERAKIKGWQEEVNQRLRLRKSLEVSLGSWIENNNFGLSGNYYSIFDYQILGNNIWAIGSIGESIFLNTSYLLHYDQDKNNWSIKFMRGITSDRLFEVKFIDDYEGYLVSKKNIYRTTDGGNSWSNSFECLSSPFEIKEFSFELNYDSKRIEVRFCLKKINNTSFTQDRGRYCNLSFERGKPKENLPLRELDDDPFN